jgi:hypothetical protein
MEDFLDHSYGTMLNAELGRKAKKLVVINHVKPVSKIGEGKDELGTLPRLWEF